MDTQVQTAPAVALQTKPIKPFSLLIQPVAENEQIILAWENYQELKRKLLNDNDYQVISGKQCIKKSGWRKIQTAFGISDELIKEERKEYGKHFVYEVTVKTSAQNGRFAFGTGSCSSSERNFAHPEHDVRSTAHTRAKNRAISDLVGGGEVSAEEIISYPSEKPADDNEINQSYIDGIFQERDNNLFGTDREEHQMTGKQRDYLVSLINQRIIDPLEREKRLEAIDGFSKSDASEAIQELAG
ncbi:MAG: hypothetical protein WC412_02135 [Candidatus Omnitrophota bacterium]|jgi:hypothetical protein